ncbi:hypothetical protein, partial [Bradyrhizobium sp.]|uniref:hypothetical protein n=1 Tax=Bradyrhizobium sp. TaxID=376 RepID=UPI0025C08F89
DQGLKPITILVDVDALHALDRLLYGWHSILRSRFQGPRWIKLGRVLRYFLAESTGLRTVQAVFHRLALK